MNKENYIFICFESNEEVIRATRDAWCRDNSNDVIINSIISEHSTYNANAALEDPEFLTDQERVRNELTKYINALQESHPKIAEILTAYAPVIFEHNLHELHKWIYTLKKIIDASPIKSKVMFPCSYSTNHLYLFEAEGETSATFVRSVLYKRTDFLTQLLKNFVIALEIDYGEYGTSSSIISGWWYHLRRITRTFGMATARGLMHFRNALRHHRNCPSPSMGPKIQLLVIVRSVIHAEFFSNLLKDQRTMCLVQDGLGVYPKVLQRAKIEGASQIIHCYDIITPINVLTNTIQVLKELSIFSLQAFKDSRPFQFELDGMPINMTTVIKECIVGSLDTRLLTASVSTITSKAEYRQIAVAHSELFTAYPHALKISCSNFQIPTFQFAFGTYEMRPVPDFIHADLFFCFSIHQRDSILSMANAFAPSRVCYAGNLLIGSSNINSKIIRNDVEETQKNIVLYYSQPFAEETDEVLISVKKTTDAMDFNLKVVMHPRERIEKFKKYGKDLCVLTNEIYIEQRSALFNKTLFAITRNSNVGYQLLLRDIPLINYLSTAKDALVKHEYYKDYPLLVATEQQLLSVLSSPKENIQKYRIFRKSYIDNSFNQKGADDVIATIFKENYAT
jgi:hypothetical protein